MNSKIKLIALFVGLAALKAAAYPIVAESGSTVGSAYALTGFTLTADATIENSTTQYHSSVTANHGFVNDVDWFSFTATSGNSIILDIDTDSWGGVFDTTMALWDSSGGLLSQSDDYGYDPGSTTAGFYYYNSRIYWSAAYTGTYFVSISDYANFADGSSPFGIYSGNGYYSASGDYDLHVSTAPDVPDAASTAVMIGLGMLFLGLVRSRMNRA